MSVCFWLLILTLGGAGYGLARLMSNRSKRKQMQQTCEESVRTAAAAMQQLFAEFRQYQKELDEYDAYHDRILDELHKI